MSLTLTFDLQQQQSDELLEAQQRRHSESLDEIRGRHRTEVEEREAEARREREQEEAAVNTSKIINLSFIIGHILLEYANMHLEL